MPRRTRYSIDSMELEDLTDDNLLQIPAKNPGTMAESLGKKEERQHKLRRYRDELRSRCADELAFDAKLRQLTGFANILELRGALVSGYSLPAELRTQLTELGYTLTTEGMK